MTKIHLKNVRLSFPNIFTKELAYKKNSWESMNEEEKARAKYTATLLLDKKDTDTKANIDKAIKDIVVKSKYKSIPEGKHICYKDGDTLSYDGCEGMWSIKAGNKKRPTAIDRDKTPLTSDDNRFYAVCYVNAIIDFFPYNYDGDAIGANLYGIQFVKDGESFESSSVASQDEFDDLEDL